MNTLKLGCFIFGIICLAYAAYNPSTYAPQYSQVFYGHNLVISCQPFAYSALYSVQNLQPPYVAQSPPSYAQNLNYRTEEEQNLEQDYSHAEQDVLTQQQNRPEIKSENVSFSTLDAFYVHEDFQKKLEEAMESTTNIFGDPTFTFPIKFESSILSCIDGPISFFGAVAPVLIDAFAEKFENKHSFVQTLENMGIWQYLRRDLIKKGITISKTYNSMRKLKEVPTRFCSVMENAHRDLYPIILHFSSQDLDYRNLPSSISQMMLAIAPVSSVIAHSLPYLEQETDMNCRLRDLFDDLFEIALFHRLLKIDVIHSDVIIQRQKLILSTIGGEIDKKMNTTEIECKMGSDGKITIHDKLEFVKDTFYTGEMKCAEDYFALVRHRLAIEFVRAKNMLNTSCDNARQKIDTENGWLRVYITDVYSPGVDMFGSFRAKVKIYFESEDKPPIYESQTIMESSNKYWFQIEETFRILTNKKTVMIITICDVNEVKRRLRMNIQDLLTSPRFSHGDPDLPSVVLYPFWEELYENADYRQTLNKATGTAMVKRTIHDHCSVNVTALRELLNNKTATF